jgi:outer membrane lipoprotein-sorting protein
MNITLIPRMKTSFQLCILLALVSVAFADVTADKLYGNLERRLQSLKSLEIRYEADGASLGNSVVSGRMVWVKPDRYLHDTPEWTLCQTDGEEWRLLKTQNTLIREKAGDKDQWGPESVLFHLNESFRLSSLDVAPDGRRSLTLESKDPQAPGDVTVEFPANTDVPDQLDFHQADGSLVRYQIRRWDENVRPDPSLFDPPEVPSQNIIDFRNAGGSK